MAGIALALALAATPAAAASGTASATMEREGYARIVFDFDRLPGATAKLSSSVLTVTFSEPVELNTKTLPQGLGALAGSIRRDPDGTAIRISLTSPVRMVSNEAGEKLFVDLLPTSWAGLPPPLPKDVIAQLTREAREARELRAEEARLMARPNRRVDLEGATHPTFRRLVFELGGDAPVDWRRDGPRVVVSIDGPFTLDAAAERAGLPVEFAGIEARRTDKGLAVTVPAPGRGAVRGFREDDSFILDIDRDDVPAPRAEAQGQDAHGQDTHGQDAQGHDAPAVAAAPAAPADGHAKAEAKPAAPDAHAAAAPMAPAAPQPRLAAPMPVAASQAVEPPSIRKAGETIRIVFPFGRPTPAAVFARGKTLWAVFDDPAPLRLDALVADSEGALVAAQDVALDRGRAARLTLAETRLVSAAVEGSDWIVSLGEDVLRPSGAIELQSGFDRAGLAAATVDLPGVGAVRTLDDPDVGDRLTVATLAPPARGAPTLRQYVEFAVLPSAQGLALALHADDVTATASLDGLKVSRDGGLSLSAAPAKSQAAAADAEPVMSAPIWAAEAAKPFAERESELILAAAMAEAEDRAAARFDLARFYQARRRPADAKGVLDAIVEDGGFAGRDERLAILRAAAEVELNHPRAALAILAPANLRLNGEAALWRAAAEAALGRPGLARASLAQGEGALEQIAPQAKARFVGLATELALDAGDTATAAARFSELEVLPAIDGPAAREVLRARLAEALGQTERAAQAYATISRGREPAAAAEAELRAVSLGLRSGALPEPDAIGRLERLVTGWRGDWIEAEGLSRLIDLYGGAERWRDAFATLRVAVEAFPDEDATRALQDKMQQRFTELFLGAGVDRLPKLEALALFYDFKELSPGGKRGDELVRRLADKLVDVELLDQAADLLNYQIDNRLTGAARAQVAARAALVELMNAKPAKALEVLRKTRQADLPASLMRARLRLEARALAETGRVDLALEIAEGLDGDEARRLKADILWSARRWPEAGEALEAALGSSWRGPDPLTVAQRSDAMRAAIAASLAGDGLAVDRIRQKFAAKMNDGPEAAGFEVVTAPLEIRGDAFREIARSVAASASFDSFLREYRAGASQPLQSADAKPAPKA